MNKTNDARSWAKAIEKKFNNHIVEDADFQWRAVDMPVWRQWIDDDKIRWVDEGCRRGDRKEKDIIKRISELMEEDKSSNRYNITDRMQNRSQIDNPYFDKIEDLTYPLLTLDVSEYVRCVKRGRYEQKGGDVQSLRKCLKSCHFGGIATRTRGKSSKIVDV